MSQQAHFWIRVIGLAVILAAQFAPRLLAGSAGPMAPTVAAANVAR
jgi:hypothetical protein